MRSLVLSALAGLSISALALVSSVTPARAQAAPPTVANLKFQNADVRQALRDLFRISGSSFTIDPAVQGVVTLDLQNVSFETALQNLTHQVDATYRREGDVYAIVPVTQNAGPRPEPGGGFGGGFGGGGFGGQGGAFQATPEPPVITSDVDYVYVLRRGTLYKVQKEGMKLVGQVNLGPGGPAGFGGPGGVQGPGGLGGRPDAGPGGGAPRGGNGQP